MILTRIAIFTMMVLFPLISQAFGSLTGTYVADGRPREILFLALTQSGNTVSGSLTITTVDGNGETHAEMRDIVGSYDGGSVDLKSAQLHLNGNQQGNALLLSTSSTSGYRITHKFIATREYAFNRMLTEWRRSLAAAHGQGLRETAAKALENDGVSSLSRALFSYINNINSTGIPADLSDMEHAISDQRIALEQINKNMDVLKRDAAIVWSMPEKRRRLAMS